MISDEVNAKLVGVEAEHRRELVKMFSFEVPGARHMPAVKLGRWDGKMSFFQLGGQAYINMLPLIIEYLTGKGYDIDLDDRRDYKTNFTFSQITEDLFSTHAWPAGHPAEGQPIMLRDYQVEAVNTFLENPQAIQVLATGAGKTITSAALSYCAQEYGRTIIIVPNKDLVKQTEADYKLVGLDVGVFFGDRKEVGRTHTICTWQSLSSVIRQTRNGADIQYSIEDFVDDVVCVMVDECHQGKANDIKALLTGPFAKVPIRWGFTGTIPKEKHDELTLMFTIGSVVGQLTAAELQDEGVLANCEVTIKQLIDYVEYKDYQSELKYLLTDDKRVEYIAGFIEDISKSGNTLVLVDRLKVGQMLALNIPDAVFLSGESKSSVRKEHYDSVATSENKVIIATYGIAAVGLNIPKIHNLILLEPGKSFVRVIQSIGRGLRKAQGKDFVHIYDLTSTCKFAKRHLTERKKYYTEAQYPFKVEKVEWQLVKGK